MASLSATARQRLIAALADFGAGNEIATLLDAFSSLAGTGSKRRLGSNEGTACVVGDFALSAGWGTTASLTVAPGSNDSRGSITITSAGTGQGANPTVTLTFHDGAWPTNLPFGWACMAGGTGTQAVITVTSTTTTLVLTYVGTPVAASTYTITYGAEG